jgi:hypothetical protein
MGSGIWYTVNIGIKLAHRVGLSVIGIGVRGRGTANGIEESAVTSDSSPEKADELEGTIAVGPRKISLNLEAGPFCASLFQVALPHSNEVPFE